MVVPLNDMRWAIVKYREKYVYPRPSESGPVGPNLWLEHHDAVRPCVSINVLRYTMCA